MIATWIAPFHSIMFDSSKLRTICDIRKSLSSFFDMEWGSSAKSLFVGIAAMVEAV